MPIDRQDSNAFQAAQHASFCVNANVEDQARSFSEWHLSYTQISNGVFRGSSAIASAGGLYFLIEDLNKKILQRGAVPANRLAIGIPLELEGHSQMCGEQSTRDTLHVFSCYSGFEFLSPERHVVANVEFDLPSLSSELTRQLGQTLHTKLSSPVVLLSPDTAENIRLLLRQALGSIQVSEAATPEQYKERQSLLERNLLYGLMEAVSDFPELAADRSPKSSKNWELVKRVQQFLQNPDSCVLSIAELCIELNLSRRTIQYAFENAIGTNPAKYLRAVRLNHVRHDLMRGLSVTEAAIRWGFLHLSAFAHDYRVFFGELPSTTSKRYGYAQSLMAHQSSD
ncbi:helix-turn-helix domain-containing protein [Pseudogulbenkiania ferrooxidans]|nr:helix-turn-helix domain-containing protein [Pseudogulbenkiania ferrooxidans]